MYFVIKPRYFNYNRFNPISFSLREITCKKSRVVLSF